MVCQQIQLQQKLGRKIVAELNEVKDNEIQRYIRSTFLEAELVELIDSNTLPLMVSVNLSYLSSQAQKEIYKYFLAPNKGDNLNLKTSSLLKEAFKDCETPVTAEIIDKLLHKNNKKPKPKPFSISRGKFKSYADRIPDDKVLEDLFMEFLKERFGV